MRRDDYWRKPEGVKDQEWMDYCAMRIDMINQASRLSRG